MLNHHTALIYTMVLASAADSEMTDKELRTIGDLVTHLPVFREFDTENLIEISRSCAELLDEENGLETALELIKGALPQQRLRETAYTLACDVVAADGVAHQEELRLLEMIRHHLEVERLVAASIERAAAARYAVLPK